MNKKSSANTKSTKFVRKLTKIGIHSYAICLPLNEVVKKFHWRERQKLILTVNDRYKTILIKD